MKTAPAREIEGFAYHITAGGELFGLDPSQVRGVEHHERTTRGDLRIGGETAGDPPVMKAGIARAPVFELPAEDLAVKRLHAARVRAGELDVVDTTVVGSFHRASVPSHPSRSEGSSGPLRQPLATEFVLH